MQDDDSIIFREVTSTGSSSKRSKTIAEKALVVILRQSSASPFPVTQTNRIHLLFRIRHIREYFNGGLSEDPRLIGVVARHHPHTDTQISIPTEYVYRGAHMNLREYRRTNTNQQHCKPF